MYRTGIVSILFDRDSGVCVADQVQGTENRASICTVSIGSMDVAADMWSIKLRICTIDSQDMTMTEGNWGCGK